MIYKTTCTVHRAGVFMLFDFLNADKGMPMRALNVTELDFVSGGEGDDNDNDNAGGNHAGGVTPPAVPLPPPDIPTQPWMGSDGNINYPP